MNSVEKGRRGEAIAESFFKAKGFSVICRNYRNGRGEIDLIVGNEREIVFVEVKHWQTLSEENMEYVLGAEKKMRILSTSKLFLRDNPQYDESGIRYDVLFISDTENPVHIKDAFGEDF